MANVKWRIREQGEANQYAAIDTDNRWLIAIQFNGELLVEEQRQLVRIIRAAPELLDAVRVLSTALNMSDPDHEDFTDSGADVVQALWLGTSAASIRELLTSIDGGA